MKSLWVTVALLSVSSAVVRAQQKDPLLERVVMRLEQPAIFPGAPMLESGLPKKLGVFTLVAPVKRGEVIRLSLPIGEYAGRAFGAVAWAHQRRQEDKARRRVEADLKQFLQQLKPRP
jgi:hypothetical protein